VRGDAITSNLAKRSQGLMVRQLHVTNNFSVVRPVNRVNLDLTHGCCAKLMNGPSVLFSVLTLSGIVR
jgi:hypothetical protein